MFNIFIVTMMINDINICGGLKMEISISYIHLAAILVATSSTLTQKKKNFQPSPVICILELTNFIRKGTFTKRCDFHSIFATVFNLWSVCSPSSPHTVSARTSNQASPFLFQHIRPKTCFCPDRFCYADGFQQRAADIVSSKILSLFTVCTVYCSES